MSALSVLDALDRQIGNNYNAAPSYEQLQEARAAVAELIALASGLMEDPANVGAQRRLKAALARVNGGAA